MGVEGGGHGQRLAVAVINWQLLRPYNLIVIGLIVIATRFAFYKAINALDGKGSPTVTQ